MTKSTLQPILILSDCHVPYHDRKALELVMKVAKDLRPHHLVTIGDLADFYAVSSHSKDPRRTGRLAEEVEEVKAVLDRLDALGAKNKIFVAGNHCDRLRRYLETRAPELFGLVDISGLFELRRRGWQYVPYKAHGKVGKLHVTHDVGTAGRYSTFQALDTYQHSIATGHSHRLQYVVEGNAVGEFKLSAQFGWLGDVSKVDYMHRAKANKNWALGFGVGYIDPSTGIAYLTPVPIVKYSCVVNGKLYRV